MFTGIIERTARLSSVENTEGGGRRLAVSIDSAEGPPWREVEIGESISVSGVCLTAVASANRPEGPEGGELAFDAVPETLLKTTLGELRPGDLVNIERSLRVGDSFGGHYVTGHVDGTARVASRETQGDQVLFRISPPPDLLRQVIPKGSIAVDGVSLTVIEVDRQDGWFSFAAIPHTLERTTLGPLAAGGLVNIETDHFGKWVLQAISDVVGEAGPLSSSDERLRRLLERTGFLDT